MRIISRKSGYTLVEILIVVALISLIASSVPITLNFRKQVDRSNDLKRKKELAILRTAFDEFYNDNNNHYPVAADVCFNAETRDSLGNCICNICGRKNTSISGGINSYLSDVPCDPSSVVGSVNKDYYYEYDCSSGTANPQWFRIYTMLTNEEDPVFAESGRCSSDTLCAPLTGKYNYAVTSPNVKQ